MSGDFCHTKIGVDMGWPSVIFLDIFLDWSSSRAMLKPYQVTLETPLDQSTSTRAQTCAQNMSTLGLSGDGICYTEYTKKYSFTRFAGHSPAFIKGINPTTLPQKCDFDVDGSQWILNARPVDGSRLSLAIRLADASTQLVRICLGAVDLQREMFLTAGSWWVGIPADCYGAKATGCFLRQVM